MNKQLTSKQTRLILALSKAGLNEATFEAIGTCNGEVLAWLNPKRANCFEPNNLQLKALSRITGIRFKWLLTGAGRQYKRSQGATHE